MSTGLFQGKLISHVGRLVLKINYTIKTHFLGFLNSGICLILRPVPFWPQEGCSPPLQHTQHEGGEGGREGGFFSYHSVLRAALTGWDWL